MVPDAPQACPDLHDARSRERASEGALGGASASSVGRDDPRYTTRRSGVVRCPLPRRHRRRPVSVLRKHPGGRLLESESSQREPAGSGHVFGDQHAVTVRSPRDRTWVKQSGFRVAEPRLPRFAGVAVNARAHPTRAQRGCGFPLGLILLQAQPV